MAYALVAQTSVNVYTAELPSDEEWDTYLRYRVAHIDKIEGVLVYTKGGSSTIQQRERLNRLPARIANIQGAVVTSSAYVRAMYRATQTTYSNWRLFSEAEWGAAFDHLGIEPSGRAALFSAVGALASKLGLPGPVASAEMPFGRPAR